MMEIRKARFWDDRSSAGRVRGEVSPHSIPGRVPIPVALKAELVFAILVIVRHRTPRMSLAFAASLVGLIAWQDVAGGWHGAHHRTAWMLTMVLAAVWCSRTMALGGSREAATLVAARWWLVPVGRLVGAMVLLAPVIGALTVLLVSGREGAPPAISFTLTSVLLGSTTGAATMALTTVLGASAAASVTFVAAVFGGVSPTALAGLLGDGWAAAVLPRVWTAFPLQWRADGWPDGVWFFGVVSVIWLIACLSAAGAVIAGPAVRWYGHD